MSATAWGRPVPPHSLTQASHREADALRRENGELRRHLREAEVSPTWRSSRSSTPRPIGITSPATTVTPQPRRQLSGQVVSRLASLELPSASSTPTWLAPSPGSTPSLAHRATLLASHTPLWGPFTTPPLPVTILPGEPQHFLSAGLQPPRG